MYKRLMTEARQFAPLACLLVVSLGLLIFGNAVSVVIGAFREAGGSTRVNGNHANNSAREFGAGMFLAPLGSGCTTPSFGTATNFGVGTTPFSVAVGDFNLDGKPDLVTSNSATDNVSVLLGNGAGSFGTATNFNVGDQPAGVTVGDFNLDSRPDLAITNRGSSNVSVLLGNGAGGFGAVTNFSVGTFPIAITVGDFNLDGKPDLATSNQIADSVSVLLGNGAGSFGAPSNFSVGSQPFSIAVGDFNVDGKPDLAVANLVSDNISVLLGNGAGSFGAATNFAAGDGPDSVAVGDFNQDGRPDLAVAIQSTNQVAVLTGNGAGSFGAPANFGVGSLPRSVAVADVNQDGKADLVVANKFNDNLSILLGNGAGGFGTATSLTGSGTNPSALVVSDFNLDGKPDLATVNEASNNVSVLLNTCNGTPCGSTGLATATNYTAGLQPQSVTTGDFNGDSKLDLAVANSGANTVSVYLGQGAGSFGAATNFIVGTSPYAVTTGDFNRDGKLDLAAANNLSGDISILLGNGAGSFGAATNFSFSNQPASIATGDFNLDGQLDLVTANFNGNNVSVYLNNGAGTFGSATSFAAGNRAFGVAVGDFNLDGKPDLAVANLLANNVSVLLGNGAGSFGAATNFAVGNGPGFVQVGDFNLDGKPDLAVANSLAPANTVSILLGNGAGSFGAATGFTVGLQPFGIAIGDYNLDGKPDLATANGNEATISVILGNGAGSFGAPTNFNTGATPQGAVMGDFNRDNKPDIAVTNYNDSNISVFLNSCITAGPQTITVDTVSDAIAADGVCSLREALTAANSNTAINECGPGAPGLDNIVFNIPGGGVKTITVVTGLPTITEPVNIDGYTQPGSSVNTLAVGNDAVLQIELNGVEAGPVSGLTISSSGSTVRGLVINRFSSSGIAISGATASNNLIAGNFIGTNPTGTTALGHLSNGISLANGASNNTLGGTTPAARNLISGNNQDGIFITGATTTNNIVRGNYIGTNAAGTTALGNALRGVSVVDSPNNTIGGTATGAGNLISGNGDDGIAIESLTPNAANGNVIQGNFVGVNAAGTTAVANLDNGIAILAANNCLIGGIVTGAGNLVSGNEDDGIELSGLGGGNNNLVQGNRIGIAAAGVGALGNLVDGVHIFDDASDNTVGGTVITAANTIANNGNNGISIDSPTALNNALLGNAIFGNLQLGIDLVGDGVTANDTGDTDNGPNRQQNFPVLTAAFVTGGQTTIQGTLGSAASTAFRIEFFANPTCDASGNGEGQVYLGFQSVTTNGSGNAIINVTLPLSVGVGQAITATATDSNGNTSEFSTCILTCAYSIAPARQAIQAAGGNGSVALTATGGCAWTATSNVPWINITSATSGVGNATITYNVVANPTTVDRTGILTIGNNNFFVTQAATGLLVSTDFSNGIPLDWTIIDGGVGTYPNGNSATWTTLNPCNRVIDGSAFTPPLFQGNFAIMDSACASPDVVLDEQLITAPFDATGLGQVILQFDNQFHWFPGGLNEVGDVDVTTNNGQTWTNVLRMQGGEDGFPLANQKTINLTPALTGDLTNVRVRFRYYATAGPLRPDAPAGVAAARAPQGPNVPTTQELWWGLDHPTLLAFTISPTSQTFSLSGGQGAINVTAGAGVAWAAQSNVPWITPSVLNGTGSGTLNFTVQANSTGVSRTGTLTVARNAFTVVQSNICPTITVLPSNPALPTSAAGTAYSQTFTQTGSPGAVNFTVSAGALPTGLALAAGGLLSGTPTVNGTFNFTVRATEANGCFGERAYTLLLNPACTAITLSPASLANGFQGTAYSQTLTATGGGAPYSFAVTGGSLPGGLNLASGGALTGTPTAAGAFSFTVTATDNTGCTGTRSYSVIVSGNGLQFYPLTAPVRLLDTRAGAVACTQPNAPIAGQTSLTQAGRSTCGIPANAVALTGNLTTVNSGGGFLTLYPSNAAPPTVASVNYAPNEIINNVFTVGLGADGAFKIFAFNTTDVVVDVTGYYAPPVTGGLYFHPLPKPIRVLETRAGQLGCTTPGAPLQAGDAGTLTQQARVTCDGVTIPSGALAIVGNATTVNPQGVGFLTLFPGNATRPLAAASNYSAGQIVNGPFSVGLAPNGEFKLYTFATTDLVVDVLGYYSADATDANGAGLLFSPLAKPVRLLETRAGQPVGCNLPGAPLTGQQEYTQTARGTCDGVSIPTNALGVVGNATVVQPLGPGFLTLWPSSATSRPTVATANYGPGEVTNRHFIVGLGSGDGAFKMYSFATSHLVLDLSGYFAP